LYRKYHRTARTITPVKPARSCPRPTQQSLTTHPALDGPELVSLQARLAHHRGDSIRAGELISECPDKLPGHSEYRDFSAEVGAPLPAK
jgi:hypothetical protein